MCLALYLFTSDPLKEIQWIEQAPDLWVSKISIGDAEASEHDEPEDHSLQQSDRRALADLVKSLSDPDPWLVICWEGDQEGDLLDSRVLSDEEIRDVGFGFEEMRKYELAYSFS